MADTAEQVGLEYPIPSYRFIVTVADEQIPFSKVSGLDVKYAEMEYKDGLGHY